MEGASEYIVVAGTGAAFEALKAAVRERELPIVEDDPRHRRLAFRLGQPHESGQVNALCAILDAGHGLTKIVVVCIDVRDGNVVAPDASLEGLFMEVEHTLHVTNKRQRAVVLSPIQNGPPIAEGATP